MHGYGRLPNLVGFANGMVKQFAATFLPSPLVYITGFSIAIGEAVIGTLLVFGLVLRPALVIGTLLMLLLIFGSTLIQQWEIVSVQMITVAFYIGVTSAQIGATRGLRTSWGSPNRHVIRGHFESVKKSGVRRWRPAGVGSAEQLVKINPLKGTVAVVSHRAIIRTPDFLTHSWYQDHLSPPVLAPGISRSP